VGGRRREGGGGGYRWIPYKRGGGAREAHQLAGVRTMTGVVIDARVGGMEEQINNAVYIGRESEYSAAQWHGLYMSSDDKRYLQSVDYLGYV